MNIFLSPHNDDETLFGAFTLIREKPLVVVVTDSYIQFERGENITAEERREETIKACGILGVPVVFLGIRDYHLNEELLHSRLGGLRDVGTVYAPALQGGNPHHDIISVTARQLFQDVRYYTTYSKRELYTTGTEEVIPTPEELALKGQALNCYQTQLNLQATRPHFEAVRGKSEWLTND